MSIIQNEINRLQEIQDKLICYRDSLPNSLERSRTELEIAAKNLSIALLKSFTKHTNTNDKVKELEVE